jgi:hypothetical protein
MTFSPPMSPPPLQAAHIPSARLRQQQLLQQQQLQQQHLQLQQQLSHGNVFAPACEANALTSSLSHQPIVLRPGINVFLFFVTDVITK